MNRKPSSNVLPLAIVGASALLVMVVLFLYIHQGTVDAKRQARTAVENCQEIELIKGQIRNTVKESVKRLPRISYYRHHPDELKQAVADARVSVARFDKHNCYDLPAAKNAGLHPPQKGQ
jgi:hypothetical protein